MRKKITLIFLSVYLLILTTPLSSNCFFQQIDRHEIPDYMHAVGQLLWTAAPPRGNENEAQKVIQNQIDTLLESLKNPNFYNTWQNQNYLLRIFLTHQSIPCGFLWYSVDNQEVFIEAVYIEKAYRAQGIATKAFHLLEAEWQKKNIQMIRLHVFADNEAALKLYKNLGFDIESTYAPGGKTISFNMRKSILTGPGKYPGP